MLVIWRKWFRTAANTCGGDDPARAGGELPRAFWPSCWVDRRHALARRSPATPLPHAPPEHCATRRPWFFVRADKLSVGASDKIWLVGVASRDWLMLAVRRAGAGRSQILDGVVFRFHTGRCGPHCSAHLSAPQMFDSRTPALTQPLSEPSGLRQWTRGLHPRLLPVLTCKGNLRKRARSDGGNAAEAGREEESSEREEEEEFRVAMPGSVAPLDLAGVTIPHHFRCPISLELMRDPVTVCTGQTYDRESIESWVATGNTTCPVTRARLADFTLIPNHTLRRLIQDWCVAHRSLGVERIPTPKQPADPALIRSLVAAARSQGGAAASRVAALRRLGSLVRESEKNRVVVSTDETRSALVEIAFEGEESGCPDADQPAMEAMAVLSMLSMTEAESVRVAARPERLRRLGEVVRGHPSTEARINAAAVIEAVVAAGARSGETRAAVGGTEGVIEGLVELVAQRGNGRAGRVGIRGLFALCLAKENRGRALAAGAAAAVVGRVAELASSDAERALATVELLCREEGGRDAVVAGWGGGAVAVAALVRVMAGKASGRAAEHAAAVLVAVLGGSEALHAEAVAAGVVAHLLLMVQGGCSERAKRKAQLLLKLFRSAWPRHDTIANSDDFLQPF
ncbi:hypothetical protein BHM03_00025859 [Ensete ventricosum]|nr:hypothetical protein BHM03_00025859 [Ensete ventricosum]